MDQSGRNPAVRLTAEVVAAFVCHNPVRGHDLPELIQSVHAALAAVGQQTAPQDGGLVRPAMSIKKSITPDHLISFEDGKPYKTLKRHRVGLGLTPSDYRNKWSLPANYPMVAPNYAAVRSQLAKSMGLGRKRLDAPVQAGLDGPAVLPKPISPAAGKLEAVSPKPKPAGRKKADPPRSSRGAKAKD